MVLSDVHMPLRCRPQRAAERLSGLWRGARTVVLNGDTFNRRLSWDEQRLDEAVGAIRTRAAADGAQVVLLAGNTDARASRRRHLFLAGRAVLVTHGDVIFEDLSPWLPRPAMRIATRRRALEKMPPEKRRSLEGQLAAAGETWLSFGEAFVAAHRRRRLPGTRLTNLLWWTGHPAKILRILSAWRNAPRLAAEFLDQFAPGVPVMVFGHTHRAGVWRIGDRTLINTGGFEAPARPLVVHVAAGRLRVSRVLRGRTVCRPGKTIARIDLRP